MASKIHKHVMDTLQATCLMSPIGFFYRRRKVKLKGKMVLVTSIIFDLKVEMNPLWQQKKLNEYCKKNGIVLTAYSALGAVDNSGWGHNRVMECDVLRDIAKSKGKTVAQISLRWLYEQGVIIAVKSFNKERMKQNLDIFDWSLTKEELNKIDQIPQYKHIYLIGSMVTEHNDVLAEIDAEID